MKYNADFIRAVALMQSHESDAAAERLFNALFVTPSVQVVLTPSLLLAEARSRCGFQVYGSDIRSINARIGVPVAGWTGMVSWIKEARTSLGLGLKEAKDLHDFVRDNPTVSQA